MVSRISAASSGSARPAARLRLAPCPGLARSSSREVIRADCPERCLRAARRALRSRAPVTGRARTCRTACSPSARPAAAPASARSGASGSWLVDSGRMSGRASRSVPPAMTAPGGSGGPAGAVTVCAPGQAASTARSIRPGGMVPGTHRRMLIPAASPPAQAYSQPRCGCPCRQPGPGRAQQPGQVAPQRRRAGRAGLRRGQDRDLPGGLGERGVLPPAQPGPARDHGGHRDGEQRPGDRPVVRQGGEQQPGQVPGVAAGVGEVPAGRAAGRSR